VLVHTSNIQETASSVKCPNRIFFMQQPHRLWYPLRPYSVLPAYLSLGRGGGKAAGTWNCSLPPSSAEANEWSCIQSSLYT